MEEHYMVKIWHVIASKENQHLTVSEQQDKIAKLLSEMRQEAEYFAKSKLKKECVQAVQNALNNL